MHSLPIMLRLADRPVILLGGGEAAAAKARLLARAGARIVGEEEETAALAIVVAANDAEAETTVARLKARGILVNAVDRPGLCDFMLPAIVDRDPVLIAIATGGASAGLAKALRERIEMLLPARLGALADALFAAREAIRARWPGAGERRRAIGIALDAGGPLDPLGGLAPDAVDRWLAAPVYQGDPQIVSIKLRSPDPDDLTLREARLLGRADRLYHAPDVPPAILDRARADAARIEGGPPADPGPGLSIAIGMRT